MNSDFDPETQAAIDGLASQLEPALTQVIDAAVRASLREIDGTLKGHTRELGTAADRVEEAFADLARRMESRTEAALDQGIRGKVIPALDEECKRLSQELVSATNSGLESAERTASAVENSLRDIQGQIVTWLESHGAKSESALAAAQGAITAAIEESAMRSLDAASVSMTLLVERIDSLSGSSDERMKTLQETFQASSRDVKESLTSELRAVAESTRSGILEAQRNLSGLMDTHSAAINTAAATRFDQLEKRLGDSLEETASRINAAGADQGRKTEELLNDAKKRDETLADEFRKEARQAAQLQNDILSAVGWGTTAWQQGSKETAGALSKLQGDLREQRNADRATLEATGRTLSEKLETSYSEQRRVAKLLLAVAIALVLLSVANLALVIHRYR